MNELSQITPIFAHFHAQVMAPDRIPFAIVAMVPPALIGLWRGPVWDNANPLLWLWIDRIFGCLGDRLDRTHRPRADLMFRGFLVSAIVIFVMLFLGNMLKTTIETRSYYGLVEVVTLSLLLTSGAVWGLLSRLYKSLKDKKTTAGGYLALSRSARTNLSIADDPTVTRVAMGYSVRAFDKGMVSPVFWYLIAGLPGALVYSSLACLAWRFGKDGFSKGFGVIPLALEHLMGFIPGLFAGILVALAGLFTPTAGVSRAFLSFLGAKGRATYEQGGYPLSALAWTLNISLGGASQDLAGSAIKGVWVGPERATAQNDHNHLRRALYICITAHILFLATLCGAYVWSGI